MDHLDLEDNTPLHLAAANGPESLVIDLIIQGAEVDASNSFGWTPLMQAARNGLRSIVSILLRHGANQEKRNKYGLTPLLLASASGDVDTVILLLNSGANYEFNEMSCLVSPLMIASFYKNEDIVCLFLNSNLDANSILPKTNIFPIMCAAAGGSVPIVNMLIKQGGKVDASCNLKGLCSALESAICCNNLQVVDYLGKLEIRLENKEKSLDIFEVMTQDDLDTVRKILAKHPTQMEPFSPSLDANHERKSVGASILQTTKSFSQTFINEPTVSDPSLKIHRKTSLSYPPETHPRFSPQIIAEMKSTENEDSNIQTDFLKIIPHMVFEETLNLKGMPPGSLVKLAKRSFSFDRFTKKYTNPSPTIIQAQDASQAKIFGDKSTGAKYSCKSPLVFSPKKCSSDQYVRNFGQDEIHQEALEMMHSQGRVRANAFQD